MKPSNSSFCAMFGVLGGAAKSAAIAVPVLMISVTMPTAQEVSQSHIDAAKAAIASTGTSTPLDNILPVMAERAKAQLISSRPDMSSAISDIVDEATIELAPRRGDLENEVAMIYSKVFTEEQLKAIAEFYLSEAGKKLLAEAPLIERQIKQASSTWGAGVQRDLSQAIGKKLKTLDEKAAE